ncbi:MAG TPA: hypothetical protein DIW46_04695 [Microbacterium sp.]|uniref:hypothetical protein n=1 Tax=Microbacterium sp. TaxID=51671 RepID=UPI000EC85EEC|nr:hypothetical protein [Microbacterium sp.]
MSYSLNGSSNDDRVETAKRQHQQRMTRFFVAFALIEGLALLIALIAVFFLKVVDPEQGIWILVGIVVIGGLVMSTMSMLMIRRHQQEVRDLTGF